MPADYFPWMESCLYAYNKYSGWKHMFWDEASARELVARVDPSYLQVGGDGAQPPAGLLACRQCSMLLWEACSASRRQPVWSGNKLRLSNIEACPADVRLVHDPSAASRPGSVIPHEALWRSVPRGLSPNRQGLGADRTLQRRGETWMSLNQLSR